MSHYAFVEDGMVTKVLVIEQDEIDSGRQGDPSKFVKTSYNTRGGVHSEGGAPLRKNYAGVGDHYDGVGFYSQKPDSSAIFNQDTYLWEMP